jgi:hypothetical protein
MSLLDECFLKKVTPNSAVVLATTKCFLALTVNLPDIRSQVVIVSCCCWACVDLFVVWRACVCGREHVDASRQRVCCCGVVVTCCARRRCTTDSRHRC